MWWEVGQKSSQKISSRWRSSTLGNSNKFKIVWQSFPLNSSHLPLSFLLTGHVSNTNGNISAFDGWVTWGEARGHCSGFLAVQSRRTKSPRCSESPKKTKKQKTAAPWARKQEETLSFHLTIKNERHGLTDEPTAPALTFTSSAPEILVLKSFKNKPAGCE